MKTESQAVRWSDGPSSPLVQAPPRPDCDVCIVVPLRDEGVRIEAALDALAHQVDPAGRPVDRARYEIVVLANNCRDDSAELARRFARRHPDLMLHVVETELPPAEAHVGRARQLLMDEAYERLAGPGRAGGVIASTDGDSRVTPTWLAATLAEVAGGAGAVGGRILLTPEGRAALDPGTRAYHLRDVGYRLLAAELADRLEPLPWDPWPRHHQHFGASLAVTTAAYRRAGGLPPVTPLEDMAFYRALVRVDARVRHSPAVRVVTSARREGRIAVGLSTQLREWTAMARVDEPYLVESAPSLVARLTARRDLRAAWRRTRVGGPRSARALAPLADQLGIDPDRLADELASCPTFGLLLERVDQTRR